MALPVLVNEGERSQVHSSGVLRRIQTRLKFEDGPNGSLCAVEFEGPPAPSLLHDICGVLTERRVSIVDSATRITPRALFQRFELSEVDGSHLVGERRREVEMLFITTLTP